MKKLFATATATIALFAAASVAHAADVSVAPSYDWTGFYVGVNAGVAINNTDVNSEVYSKHH